MVKPSKLLDVNEMLMFNTLEANLFYHPFKKSIKTKSGKVIKRWYYWWIDPITQVQHQKICENVSNQAEAFAFVAKFAGTNKINLIENEEYGYCSLIKACKSVLDKLNIENKTFAKIEYPFRQENKLIDSDSLREAVINAFVHNDYSDLMSPAFYLYSDRLEIVSYGGLIDGMSKDELVSGCSRPRNRELMRIFKDIELVEQLGNGMNRIMNVYKPDIFEISPNFFHIVFPFITENTSATTEKNDSTTEKNAFTTEKSGLTTE